jgi:hypothetical protein
LAGMGDGSRLHRLRMAKSDVERDFPALAGTEYDLSDEDFNYNCLAFALGDQSNWWEPPKGLGQYWPPGFSEDVTVPTVELIIKTHGFTVETEIRSTPGTDAIAIFAEGNEWTHFAKFSNGSWSSKLGDGHDVIGVSPEHLEGPLYGKIIKVLCRPRLDASMNEQKEKIGQTPALHEPGEGMS